MAAGLPAGGKVEIEFTAGVWTDVTADLDPDPFTIQWGRTSPYSSAQVGTLSGLRLNNATGKYTPQSQVLTDGVTAHPYYPNVLPRKRIRYSNTPAGVRFTGYIKGWPPFLDAAGTAWVLITASDRMDRLSRLKMKAPIPQETSMDARLVQWGLTEPAGSTSSIDMSGNKQPPLTLIQTGTGGTVTFGDNGPGPETGVKFTPVSVSNGQYLTAGCPTQTLNALEAWVQIPSAPASTVDFLSIDGGFDPLGAALTTISLGVNSSGQVVARVGGFTLTTASINDLGWHHVMFTRTHPSAVDVFGLYLDGVFADSVSAGSFTNFSSQTVNVGQTALSARASALFTGNVAYPALYNTVPSNTRKTAHYQAGRGYTGDTTGARIQRFLGFAGLTSADWTVDTGKAIVGTYPQAGKDILAACQDMAISEGGGAVFYVTPDGKARFADRTYRKPAAPVLTFAFEADDDGGVYAPSFDELTLFNSSDGSRATASATQSVQTVSNTASIAAYELINDQVTSYATTDLDVLTLAQSRVAANAFPGFRLPQVALDLMTAQTSHYAELPAVQIGSRIRGTGMDQGMAPATQLDLIVEGLKETVGPAQYDVLFDTSPADNPASGVWEDTSYGRWGCSGQTLNTTVTNSATTIVIATTAGLPTFTTVGSRYPMKIKFGEEKITLTAAPGGATSPQTFTGVTRGVDGTTAAAQTAGTTINLTPAATWSL